MKKFLAAIITIIYLGALVLFWNIFTADINFVKSRMLSEQGQLAQALETVNKSINKNSGEPRYYYEKAKILIAFEKQEDALKLLNKAESLNPNNLVSLKNMIPIYFFASQKEAQNYYKKLKQKYPRDAGLIVQIAKYEKRLEAEEMYKKSIEMINNLRSDLTEWAL